MSYIGSTPTTQSFIAGTDYFNGTGSAVSFTMSRAVNSVNDIEVIVNNVEQIPSGYSVSGTTLTFSVAPSAGTSNVYVRYLSTTNLSLAIPAGTSATFNTVTVADGSAATPSITNDGDTNTGIFFPAADTIAFSEGGVESVRIDASGNVGIGTASPGAKFSLTSTGSTTADGVRLTFGSEARAHNIYSALSTGRDLTIAPYRALTINTGSGTAEGVLALNAYEYTTFGTGSSYTERMRIDSSGQLIIGPGVANGAGGINTTSTVADGSLNPAIYFNSNYGGGTKGQIYFQRNSSTVGQITENGSSTSYTTTSDYRLKEDVAPMTGALAKVAALKPVTYKWKLSGSESQGFIAHELAEVVPDCVTGVKDAVEEQQYEVTPAVKDEEGNTITEAVMGTRTVPSYQGIDTSFLVATLTAAIQEQQALITALTTRVEMLENNNATQ